MARISTYIFDSDVTKNDYVIGSDYASKRTRNYKLEDLSRFFGSQQPTLGDKFVYEYDQTSPIDALRQAKGSLSNKSQLNTLFSGVQSIYLNKLNDISVDVTSFFESIREDGVLRVHNGFRTTDYGIYRVQSVNPMANGVLEIVVDLLQSNGSITDGESLVFSSSFTLKDKTLTTPELNGSVWNIQHNLNKYPSVTIVDTANTVIYAEITYSDLNNLTITFSSSVTGRAHLN